jgi:hypothetical protein
MRTLTIEGGPLPIAHGLYNALSEFHPALASDHYGGYRVTVGLGSNDRRIVAVLDEIQAHVAARNAGPTRVELGGHRYTFHAQEGVSVSPTTELSRARRPT